MRFITKSILIIGVICGENITFRYLISLFLMPNLFNSPYRDSGCSLHYILLCTIVIALSFRIMGQEKKESIMLSNEISDTIRLFISKSKPIKKIENFIHDSFSKSKDTVLGLEYCREFLKRGKIENNDKIQYFSSYQMAYIEYTRSNYISAIKNAYASVKAAERLQDTIKSLNSNAVSYTHLTLPTTSRV